MVLSYHLHHYDELLQCLSLEKVKREFLKQDAPEYSLGSKIYKLFKMILLIAQSFIWKICLVNSLYAKDGFKNLP